jgi:hypothetical protein
MVCFRYIIVNTLHKGDNKDNNNKKDLNDRMFECGMDWYGSKQGLLACPSEVTTETSG